MANTGQIEVTVIKLGIEFARVAHWINGQSIVDKCLPYNISIAIDFARIHGFAKYFP